jgi:hypothetical protein
MKTNSTSEPPTSAFAAEDWFDPIEAALRRGINGFIEDLVEQEATAVLERGRYERGAKARYRHATRARRLLGSFGPVELSLPRVRLTRPDGKSEEWHSPVVPRYVRMIRQVEDSFDRRLLLGNERGKQRGGELLVALPSGSGRALAVGDPVLRARSAGVNHAYAPRSASSSTQFSVSDALRPFFRRCRGSDCFA